MVNLNRRDNDDFEDLFIEAAYQVFRSAESSEEALKVLTFASGVGIEEAIHNVVHNTDESVIRVALEGVFLGFMDQGKLDLVLDILLDIAQANAERHSRD